MNTTKALGDRGEAAAAQYLRKRGCQLLASQWRCRYGELDLVAEQGGFLCFVEVKLRGNERFGAGAEQVDRRKQQRLRTTAELYLQQHPSLLQPRFDVVEILAPQGMATKRPRIRQIENAF